MHRPLVCAALGTLFPFLMTVLGAATVFFFARAPRDGIQRALLGFAAGVMTAAGVWSLLLPALALSEAEGSLPPLLPAVCGVLLGALFLAGMDILGERARRGGEEDTACRSDRLLISAVTLHNIPEGMAVGLAFVLAPDAEGLAAAAALAFGIGVQNFPEGAAVALPLLEMGRTRTRAFLTGALSGAVEPVFGVAAALAAARVQALMPWLLSFAAGAMLCVAAQELLPRAHSRAGTCGFFGGFLLMMALDVALG